MTPRFCLSLLLAFGFALQTGCAQDALPTPKPLDALPAVELPTPKPLNTPAPDKSYTGAGFNRAIVVSTPQAAPTVETVRPALTADPEIPLANFTPGKAIAYSQVHIKGQYIAMTFDDGPSIEYTGGLLDELKKRNMKVTFFMVGQNVQLYPQLVKRMVEEGHEVANHSWTHPNFAKMSDAAVRSEIQKTQDAIVAACGVKPTLLRPPYGSITPAQKKWISSDFGVQIILWSVDPDDWKKPGEAVVRSRIVTGAADGAIILAHDIHGSTVRAMPETFDQLLAKGYKFVTVSELLAMEVPKPTPTPKVVVAKAEPEAKKPVTKTKKAQ